MFMKTMWGSLALFCSVCSMLATEQMRDPVIWHGCTNYPVAQPTIWGAFAEDQRPKFDFDSTANYKGYRATWQIQNGTLLLLALEARVNGKAIALGEVFPSRQGPIPATWFSGTIILARGKLIGLWKGHGRDVYTKETHLTLEKGRLVRIEDQLHDPRNTPVWFSRFSPAPPAWPPWPRRKF